MDDFQKRIAAALDARRVELGWSKADLARKIGDVNVTTVVQFLNGKVATTVATLNKYIDALGVELIVRPIGSKVDKSKGEILCETESQFGKERPAPMEEELKKRMEYLYMTVEETAFYRTGFKNGAAWAKSTIYFALDKLIKQKKLTAEIADIFKDGFESELW